DATPSDVSRRLVDVNVMGTIYAARAALTEMRRQQQGHIIAVSSIVGRRGVEGSSVYAATKAAQVAFIESLRAEFAGTGLHASVAHAIAGCIERPRPEVYPYPPSKLLAILAVVAPGATDRIVERFRRRSHADGAP